VTDIRARKRLNSTRKMYAGGCSALAVIVLMLGSRGLETAVANGDTRTISLHHIHTNEDITITFKRDGRYDEEALKKLNWFVRDWRKEEEIAMDPRLFDLVWEASREVGGNKVIHVVCGYRSPATNAMLRARSSGVAKFSQHPLGKAMDFFIPGASLEELRNTGLRLQRGGVGYYPTSGSPFVHLDVGNVRHWGPAIGEAEMARIMSGHPVHVAALANTAKRASPSVASKKTAPVASPGDDEDEVVAAKPAPVRAAAPAKTNTFTVASLDSKPVEASRQASVAAAPAVQVPLERPAKAAAMTTMSSDGARAAAAPAATDRMKLASLPKPSPTGAAPAAKPSAPETTASTVTWPVRSADSDRVPSDLALAYATPLSPPGAATAMRPEPMADAVTRFVPTPAAKPAAPHDNVTTVTKKTVVRTASLDPAAPRAEPAARAAAEPVATRVAALGGATVTTKVVVANPGMRYDDPWLRAMIMAPSLWDSMTATLYGTPDLSELRTLMRKPNSALTMSFNEDPYSGMSPDRFRGDAVVFLTTHAFTQRTASLR
jgi:uncharacterized protein YcbK (DUF882 family)